MQVVPYGGQIFNQCKWRHLIAKFGTNASGAKIGTNANCNTCWPNLEQILVAFYLAGEIAQVLEAIPWFRFASCNVLYIATWDFFFSWIFIIYKNCSEFSPGIILVRQCMAMRRLHPLLQSANYNYVICVSLVSFLTFTFHCLFLSDPYRSDLEEAFSLFLLLLLWW